MTDPGIKLTMSPTVQSLELNLVNRGYKITKKYDDEKGICTVTAIRESMGSTIVAKNTSRAPLWNAYRTALKFIVAQLDEYERIAGKGF